MSTEAITLLKSIDASLKKLLAQSGGGSSSRAGAVAPDSDLNGKYGDPEVKAKDPRDWTGEPMQGRRFSECPPDYLDLVAARLDYFADKADEEGKTASNGKPASHYNRLDAARARGWAARIRSGRHVQTTGHEGAHEPAWAGANGSQASQADDDIPF